MKTSTGTIVLILFTVIATAAFVWMAKRPAADSNALVFGVPASGASSSSQASPEKTEEPAQSAT
ncbi:MAG: hypothetical protein V3V19_08455, partial [Cocleimonas sp.]